MRHQEEARAFIVAVRRFVRRYERATGRPPSLAALLRAVGL